LQLNGWLPQVNLEFADESLGISNNVFLGLDDILKNLDWTVQMSGDIRFGRFGFMPDVFAAKLSGGGDTRGPLFDQVSVQMTQTVVTAPIYYRFIDRECFSFDMVGGARYLYLGSTLSLSGGLRGDAIGPVQSSTVNHLWDGVAGFRIEQDLNDRLFYWIYGDVGTGASDATWQIWSNLGWRITKRDSLTVGYRYLTWENGNSSRDVSLTVSGPIIAFRREF
jgi:hypothetical protein